MTKVGDSIEDFILSRRLYEHRSKAGVSFLLASLGDGSIVIFQNGRCIYLGDTSLDALDRALVEWDRIAKIE